MATVTTRPGPRTVRPPAFRLDGVPIDYDLAPPVPVVDDDALSIVAWLRNEAFKLERRNTRRAHWLAGLINDKANYAEANGLEEPEEIDEREGVYATEYAE